MATSDLLYSKDHEWVRLDGDVATVGITDYAQNSLGDIVYVELPRPGLEVAQHASIGVVESVKAVSDLFTPVAGEIVEINPALEADPALVNRDPHGDGWMVRVRIGPGGTDGLLDESAYRSLIAE